MAAAQETSLAQDLLHVRPTAAAAPWRGPRLPPRWPQSQETGTKGRVQDGQVCGSFLVANGGQAAGPAQKRGAAGGLWGTRHKAWAQLHLGGCRRPRAVLPEAGGQCRSVLCAVCTGVGPQTVTAAQHSQALFLTTSARPSQGAWHLLKVRRGLSRPTAHWGQGSPRLWPRPRPARVKVTQPSGQAHPKAGGHSRVLCPGQFPP